MSKTLWGKVLTYLKGQDYTVTATNNIAVGTSAKVEVTPKGADLTGSLVTKSFEISQSESEMTLTVDKENYTYGDTITFTIQVDASKTKAKRAALNQVNLYYNDGSTDILLNATPLTLTETGGTGKATFAYDTKTRLLPIGAALKVTAKYGGSAGLKAATGDFTINLAQDPGWNEGDEVIPLSIQADLEKLAYDVNNGHDYAGKTFVLGNDIALSGQWTPIGTAAHPFAGNFDGGGHKITGLTIGSAGAVNTTLAHSGLFGVTRAASTIQNLGLEMSIYASKTGAVAGGLVGNNGSTIRNCYVTGQIQVNATDKV